MNHCVSPALALAALIAALPVAAADDTASLRAEIDKIRQEYEQRLGALENRLQEAEQRAAAQKVEPAPAPLAATPGLVGSGNAFNPQMSLILNSVFFRDNRSGGSVEMLEHLDGINHSHDHEGHAHGEMEPGFNLGESELAFSATVSPYFDANAMMTVSSEGGLELEEAYFDTRSLPFGLKVRAGKFLSGIGYLNSQHTHTWDFADQNFAYRTLLGEHGLGDTGLRLTWVPRTGSWFTQLGVELLQGREHTFAAAGLETPTEIGRAHV